MARWDAILSLPVQSPPILDFSAADLVWSKIEGFRDTIDRIARIPFARVDDFIRGESANKDCPTGFHVEARRRRPAKASLKVKVDGVLEYILYWCSFGPDDHRKGGIVRPSRNNYNSKKKKPVGRPNTKRGCTCHFIVKCLVACPSVALIIYNQDKHVDKKGLHCHGPQDKKAAGTCAIYAPFITEDLRLRVHSLLYAGVPVEAIMQKHNETVEKQGGPINRDDLLTHRYVRRQEKRIRRSKYELDADDDVSLSLWVEDHPRSIFFYQDFSESDPFTIGIQTEWQLQQMIRFGNGGLLASDSRFGTNKLKYPVHSLLVMDSENKAIPVAWVISPRFSSGDTYKWMRALHNRVLTKDPKWKLAGFVVDDPLTDLRAIRDVFECSVLISTWRVRHAWHKALMERCSENEKRIQISKRLGQIVSEICTGHGNVTLFDGLMEDFVNNCEFVEYFKAVWYPRIEFWATSLQSLPLASLEMSAIIELYHHQMNVRVFNEDDPSVYQRVDWLIDKLITKVHSYFWLDGYPTKHDFDRYWRNEWLDGLTSWRKSLEIPDSDVIFEGEQAKVIDPQDRENFYLISNPGSEFALCDCKLAEKGNLCHHVCKAKWVFRKRESSKSSLSLYQYKQVLIKILCCTPLDSLIRDHAVSFAASLETQLNALSEFEGDERVIGGVELEAGFKACSQKEFSFPVEQQGHNDHLGDANSRLLNHGAHEKGFCNERVFDDEVEMDPSSICVSPSSLFTVHGVLPADIMSIHGDKTLLDDSRSMNETNSLKVCEFSDQANCVDMTEEHDINLATEFHDPCPVNNQGEDACGDKVDETVNFCEDTTPLKFYMRLKKRKTSDKGDGQKMSRDMGQDNFKFIDSKF